MRGMNCFWARKISFLLVIFLLFFDVIFFFELLKCFMGNIFAAIFQSLKSNIITEFINRLFQSSALQKPCSRFNEKNTANISLPKNTFSVEKSYPRFRT